jgi:hypothetical protein
MSSYYRGGEVKDSRSESITGAVIGDHLKGDLGVENGSDASNYQRTIALIDCW